MIATDGWAALRSDRSPNTDLIPTERVVARCYPQQQAELGALEARRDAISRELEELDEEHSGDEDLLAEARTDKGKLTAKSVKDRLKAIQHDADAADERQVLKAYEALLKREADASKQVKEAQRELDATVAARYARMSEPEVQALVVLDKWLATLDARVQSELDRVSQQLTGRIKQLADRYATPLPQLAQEVEALQAKVDEHLKMMGFAV